MGIGLMSHVEFKKYPWCRVDFRGQGPKCILEAPIRADELTGVPMSHVKFEKRQHRPIGNASFHVPCPFFVYISYRLSGRLVYLSHYLYLKTVILTNLYKQAHFKTLDLVLRRSPQCCMSILRKGKVPL